MNTIECINTRRSVRQFKDDAVPDNIIDDIINAGICAPSAGNTQEWHFVVVKKPEYKKKVAEAAFGQEFVEKAPVLIVVCADLDKIEQAYGERGISLYAFQDTAAAIQNMLLAAWENGIGSCWVGAFNEAKLKNVLVLPTNVKPVAILPMGYPEIEAKMPVRRSIDEVYHEERWE